MRATNLQEALNILDPKVSLCTAEQLDNYFVPRESSPIKDILLLLKNPDSPKKMLFTGHRGSGKSTELSKLTYCLGEDYYYIHYPITRVLNPFDLTYVDVVLSLGLELFRRATTDRLPINSKLLEDILLFTREVSKETESIGKVGGEIEGELNAYVVKLTSKLINEDATRLVVRENLSHRISDLLEKIELICEEIKRATDKQVLVVIEDLDKTDLETAKQLFYQHSTSLLAPCVSIIYTFPIALRHDNNFIQVKNNFINCYSLPNLKTRTKDGGPVEDGIASLKSILTKRVSEELFSEAALTLLAESSGGIPRELITLAQQACLETMKANRSVIDEEAVTRSVKVRRMDYEVLLSSKQLALLKAISETKQVENDEEHRALLHNLSVLEYRNDSIWYDVHPIVKPLLERAA